MNEPHPLSSAAMCGRYRVMRLLGRGGMAAVYEVEHETLGRRFALKALLAPGGIATARLEREARALARLDHPHIVAPVDFGVEDHGPYLVMELVTGETLATRLARIGRLDLTEMAAIFLPVCSALAAAHATGVVHRDLKPSNVALSVGPGGRLVPKVLDFGVAKSIDDAFQTLTGGGVLGTVSYLSPEVARGERSVDERTDVYSLGVMLFECATGQLPFRGESSYEIMHRIVTGSHAAPSSIASDLPPEFDALAESALAREREHRLPSARALGRALLAFADDPTRALWQREFAVETPTADARAFPAAERDATLTEDHLAAIGGPRSSLLPGRWARSKTALLLGVAALALVGIGGLPFAGPPAATGSVGVAPAPATALSPTIAKPDPSASSPPDNVAPPPSSSALPVPVPTPASHSPSRVPWTHSASAAPAPPASTRPFERGANGALILE
jgi:serine/threonine-protein kinase